MRGETAEHAVRTDLNFWWRKVKAAVVNNLFVLLHFLSLPIGGVLIFSGTETCYKAEVAQPRPLKLERRSGGYRLAWRKVAIGAIDERDRCFLPQFFQHCLV
ncbi:hypothetical protein ACFX1Q_047327 [Malus domestica]